ncbi:MAG: biotin transporter BioY [Bifidobacteriaceae bacterium]|nr:biotin transporter BioY [Bifidobacteriaceae bacterium]
MALHFFTHNKTAAHNEISLGTPRDAAQTHDTSPLVTWLSRGIRVAVFTGLLIVSTLVGVIPLPGNPVGITLQTFVLMLIALSLGPCEAASAVASYLAIGAAGFPVFSGGMSTAALVGPSAGYLYAFVPAVFITALLRRRIVASHTWSALVRDIAACLLGCVVLPLLSGIPVQAAFTGTPLTTVAAMSSPFIINDCIKVMIACIIVRTAAGITHRIRG